jgi:hypothetical protein
MPFATYDSQIITCRPYSYSDRSGAPIIEQIGQGPSGRPLSRLSAVSRE